MRAHDWASTPLGEPKTWPEGLKAPLRMMLCSRFEMWLGWGQDLAFFYNDAYVPTLGVKHPNALGLPMRDVWKEVFEDVRNRIEAVMRDGVATWDKALMLLLERSGYLEETYHTFSYSPLRGDSGAIEGLMCVVSEETERVLSERRMETLRTLATALLPARSRREILDYGLLALQSNTKDFPFSLIHLFDNAANRLAESIPQNRALEQAAWPFGDILQGTSDVRAPLKDLLTDPPQGGWTIPPTEALIVPIAKAGHEAPSGALVLGLNPYRPNDPEALGFAQLLAVQLSGALATVDAQEAEALEMERLRQLFEQSPSFMAVLRGPAHRFELVNPAYSQLVAHRDVIGKPVREAVPEVGGQGFFELLDQVYSTGEAFFGQSVQIKIQRRAGAAPEDRFLDFVYQPIRNAEGAVSGIFVEGVDVTSTREVVAALKDSEAQFRTLAEAMPNHVWISPPDGRLDWFNRRTYEFSGAVQGELDGVGWTKIVHPDDVAGAGARWAAALESGDIYETEFRLRRADGVYRWHIARAVAIRDEADAIVRWIGTNTDIDDQKTTAEALAKLNATLEQQVAQRTDELMIAEEALRQSQKMEAVGQLTGGIAHDFNNLLTGISGSLDLIRRRLDAGRTSDIPRLMDAASTSTQRAAALTHRLLAFARRQSLDTKPHDINALVAGLEDMLRRTLGEAIALETALAADLWRASADANQLENALINLVINARDAMPDGGKLTIETSSVRLDAAFAQTTHAEAGDYVVIAVSDTGTGMSPEVMAKAFDPFFTTKPIGQGTGLGLSMIYGFAKQSGGHVRIYSEAGRGTTVKLFLRRADNEPGPAPVFLAQAPRGMGEMVLVVEDDSTVRLLMTQVLDELGYRYLEAPDARSAIPILASAEIIDLLVTDVGLPNMNGRQLAEIARQHRPHLKILFVTGYAETAASRGDFLAPGMEMMTKPFALDQLGAKIRELIER